MCTVIFVGLEAFLSSSSHLSIGCVILWKPLIIRLDWKVGDQVCKSQHKSKALGVSDRGFEDESDEKAQETEGTFQQLTKQSKKVFKKENDLGPYTPATCHKTSLPRHMRGTVLALRCACMCVTSPAEPLASPPDSFFAVPHARSHIHARDTWECRMQLAAPTRQPSIRAAM